MDDTSCATATALRFSKSRRDKYGFDFSGIWQGGIRVLYFK